MNDRITGLPARELLERLSTSAPTPGGGSAAALAGAMAAALVEMVVALTAGRPAAGDDEAELGAIGAAAGTLRIELLDLAEADAAAYEAVVAARRLPRETEAQAAARATRIADATRGATLAPVRILRSSDRVLGLAERLAPIGNRHAISDVGVAALLAAAAVRGAGLNVRINLPYLDADDPLAVEAGSEVDRVVGALDRREEALGQTVEGRIA